MEGARPKGRRKNTGHAAASTTLLLVLIASLTALLAPSAGAAPGAPLPGFARGLDLSTKGSIVKPIVERISSPGHASHASKTAAEGRSTIIPGHYIVALRDSVAHPAALAEIQTEQRDAELGPVYRHAVTGYAASGLSKQDVESLRENPKVRYVEPDHIVKLDSQTTPAGILRSFAAADPALKINEKEDLSVNANVAIIDSGIDYTHPDLNVAGRTNCVPAGENPYNPEEKNVRECIDNSGIDGLGHGTHVAGTIGAKDNGFGVVGMAPGVNLWAVRVFSNEGETSEAWLAAGLDWVAATRTDENPANDIEVANMSWGCACTEQLVEDAISGHEEGKTHVPGIVDDGVVAVVAAGNDASDASGFSPAKNPDVITVSSLADSDGKPGGEGSSSCYNDSWEANQSLTDDTLASSSNWGPPVDVAAPGVCILSTVPLGGSHLSPSETAEYATASGTSMAAPHVSGAAAVLASASKPEDKADVEAIRQQIVNNGNLDYRDTSGDLTPEPVLDMIQPEPSAATGGTSDEDSKGHSATLHGALNPGGQKATYWFEYGTSTEYGHSTTKQETGAETKYIEVSQAVSSLKLAVTYHYRLTVLDGKGVYHHGDDRTFGLTRWSAQPMPEAETAPELENVSCSGDSFCMAVGSRLTPTGEGAIEFEEEWGVPAESYYRVGLAEKWNGTEWSVLPAPVWAEKETGDKNGNYPDEYPLFRVSCASTSFCIAFSPHSYTYLAAVWDGKGWSPISVPKGASIGGVSCLSANWCMAVGVNEQGQPAAYLWDGSKLTAQAVPHGEATSWLNSVSCTSASFCEAVGRGDAGARLAARWDGSKWTTETLPAPPELSELHFNQELEEEVEPAREESELTDVACSSTGSCMAIGAQRKAFLNSYYFEGGFSEQLSEGKWTVDQIDPYHEIRQPVVSCVAARQCTVAGFEWSEKTLAHLWNGSSWVDESLPNPSTQTMIGAITDVSCLSDGACRLVGYGVERNFCSGNFCFGGETTVAEYSRARRPTVGTEAASGVSAETATLNATIDPEGLETEYRFEYGTSEYKQGEEATHGTSVPVPSDEIGSGFEDVAVSQTIESLKLGMTYHYRVVATNAIGTTYGEDRTFKTKALNVASQLADMPVTEPFDGSSASLERFGAKWSALGWASGSTPKGSDTTTGWKPSDATTVSGAFYESSLSGSSSGIGAVATLAAPAGGTEPFISLWLDMPTPSGAKAGYQLRFVRVSTNTYNVVLSKWVGGTETELATKASYSLPVGSSFAIADLGSTVSAWTNTGSGFIQLLSAEDSTFESGKVGLGGTGTGTRLTNFKVGMLKVPKAITEAATSVDFTSATLNGTVNPEGSSTSYYFEYGKTNVYLNKIPGSSKSVGSGTSNVAISEALSGLKTNTTYHFRLVAESELGTTYYGKDKTFKTKEVAGQLASMSVTEPFDGSSASLERFGSKWSALGWAGGFTPQGSDTSTGWKPASPGTTVNGAFYESSPSGSAIGAVVTLAAPAGNTERYTSLWLDMPTPTGTKAGYQLRFAWTSTNTYNVTLSKWVGDKETELATKASYSLPTGSSFAIADLGSTVSAWTNTGSGFIQLLSAEDSTFESGKVGLGGTGAGTRLTNFKVGTL